MKQNNKSSYKTRGRKFLKAITKPFVSMHLYLWSEIDIQYIAAKFLNIMYVWKFFSL